MKRSAILTLIGTSMLVLTLACSGGNADAPTSPSAFNSSPSALGSTPTGSTTIMGTTSGLTSAPANRQLATATISAVSGVQVCVNGTTTCSSLDPAGRFELRGEFTGDVRLEVVGLEGPIIVLTIPAVSEGETIVVRLEISDSRSRVEILSRTRGGGGSREDNPSTDSPSTDSPSTDDASTDDASTDDASTDDASTDDASTDDASNGGPGKG